MSGKITVYTLASSHHQNSLSGLFIFEEMVTDEQLSTRKYDRLRLRNFNEQKIENKQDKNGKEEK